MAARAIMSPVTTAPQASPAFAQVAGLAAILTGLSGFLYAVAFIVLRNPLLSAVFLTFFGLLSTAALVAVYRRLQHTDADFALWALALGLVGALGGALHGGYDLANALNPPTTGVPDLPSAVDPR